MVHGGKRRHLRSYFASWKGRQTKSKRPKGERIGYFYFLTEGLSCGWTASSRVSKNQNQQGKNRVSRQNSIKKRWEPFTMQDAAASNNLREDCCRVYLREFKGPAIGGLVYNAQCNFYRRRGAYSEGDPFPSEKAAKRDAGPFKWRYQTSDNWNRPSNSKTNCVPG